MKAQWRALQSAPQFAARINLASSEISKPTVQLLQEANQIVKEMRRTAKDDLVFHSFNYGRKPTEHWTHKDLVFLSWGDASHKNRANLASTGGLVIGISTPDILNGTETPTSLLDWRSWKLRRIVAGSNSSESQAICEAEDKGFKARLMMSILHGYTLTRYNSEELVSTYLSFLVMDSRGCYDALTGTETPGLSMESARGSVDIWATAQGLEDGCNQHPAWVPGNINLSDGLTKHGAEAYKTMTLYLQKKAWVLKFNDQFVSARKQQKLRKQKKSESELGALELDDDIFSNPFGSNFQR